MFPLFLSIFLLTEDINNKSTEIGYASYYSNKFNGRKTASGEVYYHNKLTGAHRTLPLGTIVRVTNLKNGNKIYVKINDRGPFVNNRIIDVSKQAANKLEFIESGITKVKVEIFWKAK